MEQFWMWLILGFLLVAAELVSGAFIILFFGIGGILTAVLAAVGVHELPIQVTFFAVVSTGMLFLFRRRFVKTPSDEEKQKALSPDIGIRVTLSEGLPAHGEGTIAYQGTHWTAVNLGSDELERGASVQIERTEGIKIFVRRAPPLA